MQEMAIKITAVAKDVEEIRARGAEPMRERMTKVETVIETIKPTLDRIERKIDRHLSNGRYGASSIPDPNDGLDTR
jgi:tetrahydromethanopterin S-methyltransferase subunit B